MIKASVYDAQVYMHTRLYVPVTILTHPRDEFTHQRDQESWQKDCFQKQWDKMIVNSLIDQ